MSKPLTDAEYETIATMLRGGSSYTEIHKATGRANGTIARVAKEIGHKPAHSAASRLRNAHAARSAYCAETRAEHASTAQERVGELLAAFHDDVPAAVATSKGVEVITMRPTARDYRDRSMAVQTMQRMVLDVHKADAKAEESPQATLLVQFVSSIRGDGDSAN